MWDSPFGTTIPLSIMRSGNNKAELAAEFFGERVRGKATSGCCAQA